MVIKLNQKYLLKEIKWETFQGFMAEHMTVCGGHLEADDTPNQIYRYAHGGIHKFRQTNPLKFVLL